jgi:hypothetical protein
MNDMWKTATEAPDFSVLETSLTDYFPMVCVMRSIRPDFTLAKVTKHPFLFGKTFVAKLTDISESIHLFQRIGREFTLLTALSIAKTSNTDFFAMIFIKRGTALNTVSA